MAKKSPAALAWIVPVAAAGVGIYAVADAFLSPIPISRSPGFVETVFASRVVVASVRVALVFASAFVVASVVALIARGQWLTRVGPVHVSERVSELRAENRELQRSLDELTQINEDTRKHFVFVSRRMEKPDDPADTP